MNCIDLTSERSKCWVTSQNIQNNAKLQSDQITMNCIDLMSKLSKMLSYVSKNSKERKTTKWSNYNELHRFDVETIKTTQNYKRDQIMINLHRFDVKTIQNVELRLKKFKRTQNYKTDQR